MHSNVKNIINMRFGKLVATEFAYIKDRMAYWKCKCDCGNECIQRGSDIRRGTVKSCGCLNWGRHRSPDRKEIMLKAEYCSKIRKAVKRRNIINNLSYEEWKKIIFKPCYYCGIENSLIIKDNHNGQRLVTDTIVKCNGIDRIDSSKEYCIENCVSCCMFCNFSKGSLSQEIFYNNIKRLYNNLCLNNKI